MSDSPKETESRPSVLSSSPSGACSDDSSEEIRQAAKYIREAKNMVLFTGAGMSKDSGIDTFRGSNGLWSGLFGYLMLMYGGTPFGWSLTPGYTWSVFVKQFYLPIAQATPHLGYYSLHAISEKYFRGKVQIVTMNVDGLHQASGFSDDNVSEVHGTVRRYRCGKCSLAMPDLIDPTAVPVMRCSSCNGYPRPDVTLFYETLPEYEWTKAVRAVRSLQKGDVLLVVGTSSVVYPAASLPSMARSRGAYLIEINPADMTPLKDIMDLHIKQGAAQALTNLAAALDINLDTR